MSNDTNPAFAEPVAAILNFHFDAFCLGKDLERLHQVRKVEAPDAVVFYCGRILEVLSQNAVRQLGSKRPSPSFSNLSLLERMNLLAGVALILAHGLRRLGNDARHGNRQLATYEAEVALVYLERWLQWFFCQYRLGPRFPNLVQNCDALILSGDAELRAFVIGLDQLNAQEVTAASLIQSGRSVWQRSSSIAASLAEELVARGNHGEAVQVLDEALANFPDELRLMQLRALQWSRTEQFDLAIRLLEDLHRRFPDDEETTGIYGGLTKRIWQKTNNCEFLAMSHRLYHEGWEKSKKNPNVYLGINAASTALWLHTPQKMQAIAEAVRDILMERQESIKKHHQDLTLGFWDELTLGEAHLLLRNYDLAQMEYRTAFAREPNWKKHINTAKEQAERLLRELGKSEAEVAAFFEE
jgi:tetratricopeptide (TPR) repeat protein